MAYSWRETCRSTRTFPIPKQRKKTTRRPPRNSSVLSAPKDAGRAFQSGVPDITAPFAFLLVSRSSSGCESDPPRAEAPIYSSRAFQQQIWPLHDRRLATRTRSSVTYSITDSHAIVSLANPQSGRPATCGKPVMHAARKAQGTDATAIRLSKITGSLEPPAQDCKRVRGAG